MTLRDPSALPTAPHAPAVLSSPIIADLGPGYVIADRYEVRSRLGAGGMGAVWRTLDRALNEEVAVKVLLHEGSGDPIMVDRFRRELKLGRRIAHPNVCRVFDLGEADGLRFLTMELIEGQTLRAHLANGPLEPKRALSLLQQVASGLAAAHEQSIIHRDLKPENVLVRRDGQAVVVDFGLARAALASTATLNAVAGTPSYMSPEQHRGEPLSAACDVFALGLLGFELLTARSPFGDGAQATIVTAILRDPPRRLEVPALPAEVSLALDALFARALAKRPEERFPSASAFGDALSPLIASLDRASDLTASAYKTIPGETPAPLARPRRRVAGIAAAVTVAASLVGLTAGAWRAGHDGPAAAHHVPPPAQLALEAPNTPAADARPAIVVMPFDNLTGEPSWDGLRQGATEAILAGLRTMPQIRVADAPPAGEPVAEAKRRGAVWLVTGTVQRVGASLRVAAQVWATDGPIAGEPIEIDGDPGGVPRLLDALRDRTLDEIRLLVRDYDRQDRALRGTSDAAARATLLRYYAMIGPAPRPQHHAEGKRLLDEAIARDDGYVPALAERAYLQSLHAYAQNEPGLYAAALADLDHALSRAPDDAQALVMRCRVLQVKRQAQAEITDADNEAALDACEAARHAAPGSAAVLLVFARLYDDLCQHDLASAAAEQAIELDRSIWGRVLKERVMVALHEDKREVADRMSLRLLAFDEEQRALGPRGISRRMGLLPEPGAHLLRAAVLLRDDRLDEARRALNEELTIDTGVKADGLFEAASLRGLLRIARQKGEPANAGLAQRLAVLERRYQAEAAKTPHVAEAVAGAYLWTDPDAAVVWLARVGAPRSFRDALQRALAYRMAGKSAAARAALAAHAPSERWEQGCATWLRSRLLP